MENLPTEDERAENITGDAPHLFHVRENRAPTDEEIKNQLEEIKRLIEEAAAMNSQDKDTAEE